MVVHGAWMHLQECLFDVAEGQQMELDFESRG